MTTLLKDPDIRTTPDAWWRSGQFWGALLIAVGFFMMGAAAGYTVGNDNDEVAALQKRQAQMETELATAHEAARGTAEDNGVLQSQLDTAQGQVTDLQGQVDDLEKDVRHWKDKVTEQARQGGYSVNATATFGDGTWRVGEEIIPGTYQASGGNLCYWERLSGFSGSFGDIITNDFGSKNATVTIASTDAGFTTEDCGTWHKL